ncbi:hypothetical protein DDZ14_02230 [Maritimibacter sp. 55A14]|uniref:hypothetical protein n=1 Tax=Maritimibacter sp. 55A14 TaxID=2174844 RepID=UPI000D61F14B|nr:hypothetical protein [Maritimibacter sp. 55A14]PWE34001.1 hypothetical protein DDZ14_02230 [Maritimibacter sp. 55A14]
MRGTGQGGADEAAEALTLYRRRGWLRFPTDPRIADWVAHAAPKARAIAADPKAQAAWLRCGGTWFAGVNMLDNAADGSVAGSGPLAGAPVDFIRDGLGLEEFAWDAGQISVCYPGYPQPWAGESEAAFRFRRDRDAAHLDGLLREAPGRRRRLREHHGFILGLPLCETGPGAAPLVVWEGSHEIIRTAFSDAFEGIAPQDWGGVDVTDIYQQTRRRIFETCPRIALHARPGEAYLVHRLALHGVAPWQPGAAAPPEGRMIAYFRLDAGRGPRAWLTDP